MVTSGLEGMVHDTTERDYDNLARQLFGKMVAVIYKYFVCTGVHRSPIISYIGDLNSASGTELRVIPGSPV